MKKWQSTGLDTGCGAIRSAQKASGARCSRAADLTARVSIHAATAVLIIALFAPALHAQDNYISVVREEKAKLIAAGYSFFVSSGDEGSERGRCDAAQITWRVAKRLSDQGVPIGLVHKSGGQKGCTAPNGERYSHDALVYARSGACRDILARSETENEPAWNICDQPFMDAELFRAPFALDPEPAPAPTPAPPPPPGPPPVPPSPVPPLDLSKVYEKLDAIDATTKAIKDDTGEIRAGMNRILKFTGKYIAPVIGAVAAGWFMKPEPTPQEAGK